MSEKKFKYTDHPSITIIAKKPKLRIFEDFAIEEKLPKFQIKINDPTRAGEKNTSRNGFADDVAEGPNESRTSGSMDDRDLAELKRVLEGLGQHVSTVNSARWDRERYIRNKLNEIRRERDASGSVGQAIGKPPKKTVKDRIVGLFKKPPEPAQPVPIQFEYDIETAFQKIKDSFELATTEQLEKNKRLLDAVMKRLEDAGQYQKVIEMQHHAFVMANEITLAQDGRFNKYLTEDQLIKFMIKSEKGVNIEFLRYYDELMPKEVIDMKIEADKLMIFDNYAVIHYDTKVEKFGQIMTTEEEIRYRERRRDPILVGLIQGSHKLHYICDWVTAEDDLTLEKVETLIAEKAHTLTKIEKDLIEQSEITDNLLMEVRSIEEAMVRADQAIDSSVDL